MSTEHPLVRQIQDAFNFDCASDLMLRANLDPTIIAAVKSASQALFKKYVPKEQTDKCKIAAIELFKQNNSRCVSSFVLSDEDTATLRVWASGDFPDSSITWYDLLNQYGLKTGPGASYDSHGENSFFEKMFSSSLTTANPALCREFLRFIAHDPALQTAMLSRSMKERKPMFVAVNGSKLLTVPKNSVIDRTIATEPSLNMMFQMAVAGLINNKLCQYGYDASLQPDRNRELARRGSIDNTVATVDLRSASDLISLTFCERILPAHVFAMLLDCRVNCVDFEGESITLNMVSTMGCGFTFALETYIFTLISRLAMYKSGLLDYYDRPKMGDADFGVFGDDIILPCTAVGHLYKILEASGFIVNEDKSFVDGPFRESCGSDWFKGKNTRGVYIKCLDTIQDRCSAVNRLIRWSALHGIPIPRTLSLLLPRKWWMHVVPPYEADTAGIKIPGDGAYYFHAFQSVDRRENIGKKLTMSPYGTIFSYLNGSIERDEVTRRIKCPVYKEERMFTPSWSGFAICDIETLEGQKPRFSPNFDSWFSYGTFKCAIVNPLNGVSYRDWSDCVERQLDLSTCRRFRVISSNGEF